MMCRKKVHVGRVEVCRVILHITNRAATHTPCHFFSRVPVAPSHRGGGAPRGAARDAAQRGHGGRRGGRLAVFFLRFCVGFGSGVGGGLGAVHFGCVCSFLRLLADCLLGEGWRSGDNAAAKTPAAAEAAGAPSNTYVTTFSPMLPLLCCVSACMLRVASFRHHMHPGDA